MTHHEPFKSLGPIAWDTILLPSPPSSPPPAAGAPQGTPLPTVLTSTFDNAQILVDSIPNSSPTTTTAQQNGHRRARSHTESAVSAGSPVPTVGSRQRSSTHPEAAALLRKEWKEVKVNAKDNPLGISVYKMAAKDGKGSWFARRSVHSDVGFEKWRMGLKREFEECLSCETGGGENGSGSVRGIGAERRVGRRMVEGVGVVDVFLVSVRFPGPTTPRDFVTMLAMPEEKEKEEKEKKDGKRLPRQFMLVSRPCEHPDTPARSGFIRGTYESVEVIREIPVERPVRRTRSTVDLSREAVLRAARQRSSTDAAQRMSGAGAGDHDAEEEPDMEIEWLMVTRSDPGGSVPRFMVEKGTPGGIINDAGKFLRWIASKSLDELTAEVRAGNIVGSTENQPEQPTSNGNGPSPQKAPLSPQTNRPARSLSQVGSTKREESVPTPSGFYGMIAGALEAAGSIVINRMGALTGSAPGTDNETLDSGTESDLSDDEYASAEDGEDLATSALHDVENGLPSPTKPGVASSAGSARSTISEGSQIAPSTAPMVKADQHHDKELRRLFDRQRRAEEKMARTQERHAARNRSKNGGGGEDSDIRERETKEAALIKLREKHERELAKQEEKYQREVRRIHEKREAEMRKAEERRRKAQEREERTNLQAELERVKAERDVALREIEMLKEQVGALQGQNTMLVAKLGKEGGFQL